MPKKTSENMDSHKATGSATQNALSSSAAVETGTGTTGTAREINHHKKSLKREESTRPRRLAAFDFDHTIVHDNTDKEVQNLLKPEQIPNSFKDVHNWTNYMREIFKILHQNEFTPETIKNKIRSMHEVPGMVDCIKTLYNNNFDIIIISDSNSVFINEWLDSHGIKKIVRNIFTNPAKFNDHGQLEIQPFHKQTDCKLSAENLCKGKILEDFINEKDEKENLKYENIFYIGDGENDICPSLRLSKNDYTCARKGYNLHRKINKYCLKAILVTWESGTELKNKIYEHIDDFDRLAE